MTPVKTRLYQGVYSILFPTVLASSIAGSASAQETPNAEEDKIIITGSRISRTQAEGAATVVTMTAEEMQQQGFTTLYEALSSFTSQTGSFIGEQFTSGFQPNAQALNFRGLGPGRTLILLDGRRIADYPSPYNGTSNFVNLAQFPMAIIQQVEVMAGGASAIYGSDAMAGVVNIITKKDLDSNTVSVRVGTTDQGGGNTKRAQWYGGTQNGDFSALWSFEAYDSAPVTGADRESIGFRDAYLTLDSRDYFDNDGDGFVRNASGEDCANLSFDFVDDPDFGPYCTGFSDQYRSLRNDRERLNGFANLNWDLGNYNEFSVEAHFWDIQAKSNSGPLFWDSGNDIVVVDNANDLNVTDYVYLSRTFSEISDNWTRHDERGADLHLGFNGLINLNYDYELVLSHSFQKSSDSQTRFKEEAVNEFFLGEYQFLSQFGDVYTGTNTAAFTQPLNAEDISAVTGIDSDDKESSVTSLSFTLTGDWFEFGDGFVQFATVAEVARKEYEINLHPRTLNTAGEGWWGLTGTEGKGNRDRYALGLETRWPLADNLDVTLAGRYDKYNDDTAVDDAFTYNVGVEYRPVDSLLVRATATSNFRAPDMHYVNAGQGGFFLSDVYDPANDTEVNITGTTQGNTALEEETGNTVSFGMVFEPSENLSFSMDWYEIEIDDLVASIDVDELLAGEAACAAGDSTLPASLCSDISSRINRDGANTLLSVSLNPINTAFLRQQGIDSSFKYAVTTESAGIWAFHMNHTVVLESERQLTEFSEVESEWRDDRDNNDLRSRFRGGVSWLAGDFRTSLLANRIGSLNSIEGGERLDPWTLYNLSVSYMATSSLTFDLIVNNATDEDPQVEEDRIRWPYFNASHYNAIGREVFLEAKYEF